MDLRELCSDLLRNLGPEARNLSPNPIPPNIDITVQNLIAHASSDALDANQDSVSGANIIAAILSGEGGMITQKLLLRHGLSSEVVAQKLKKPTTEKPESVVTTHQDKNEDKPKGGDTDQQAPAPEEKLSDALESDDLMNSEPSLVDSDIVDDTIVQAEAHPSDYGTGEADHPVPPEQHSTDGQTGKKKVAALKQSVKKSAPECMDN